ncbi:ComEA family DNA-binding protein [Streptantibioticus parmotrematis]|nr:ComEA family DNA-binding protein [Streptantibioticus parmotrematis]
MFERLPVWLQLRCGMELCTVAALAGVLVIAVALAVHHFWTGRPRAIAVPPVTRAAMSTGDARSRPSGAPPDVARAATPSASASVAVLVVDVSGKVRRPGVLRLPPGSRVLDALTAAGGALPGVDTGTVNLARPLVDGEQIVVGAPQAAAPAGGPPGTAAGAAAAGAPGAPGAPVSLGSATEAQLDALPGVGPVLAQRIIDYRNQHGGFTSVNQLRQVTGVGERRFQELQPLVRP